MMKRTLSAAVLCLALLCAAGCSAGTESPSPAQQSQVGFYFDTVVTMMVYSDDDTLLSDAQEECRRYDALLSKTVEGSDVWNINHANGERVTVSPETREILEKAQEFARSSDGMFDVTVAPCVALWDFSESGQGILPDEAAMADAAARVDWTKLDINDSGVLLPAGMSIDLGAIAKGYITDRIADFLKARGVTSGYLNFGGNVLTIGTKPDGSPWIVGVQDPANPQGIVGTLPVESGAMVTSGIYERGFDLDGVRYHHLLDSATGWPIQNELSGVTILSGNAFDADALSTTVFAMGTEKGIAFIEQLEHTEAIFVNRDGSITCTSGLEGRFTPQA